MLLVVIILSIATRHVVTSASGPVSGVFDVLKTTEREGCDVTVLPDSVDWCNGSLVNDHLLPHSTVCQSRNPAAPYLVCSNGRWLTRQNQDPAAGRQRRAISQAVSMETDRQCFLFCVEDVTQFVGKHPPTYDTCPASVTLYPEVGWTEVSHDWDEPIATDVDGDIVLMEQIVGPSPPSTFESSIRPGTQHHVAYMAQDDEAIIWPCSFIVTAEIPTCPPVLAVTNGQLYCDDANNRGSNCTFVCNHGYELNSTNTTAECRTSGQWSFGEDEPQCLSIECDSDLTNATSNVTDIELVCPDDVTNYDTVCWVRCLNDYVLRNDMQEDDLINSLSWTVDNATADLEIARQEAKVAQEIADVAYDNALAASLDAEAAVTASNAATEDVTNATADVGALSVDYSGLLTDVDIANEFATEAVANGDPRADEYLELAANLAEQAVQLKNALEDAIFILETVSAHEEELFAKAQQAQTLEYEAWMYANETILNAALLADIADVAADVHRDAIQAFTAAQVYQGRADRVVNTYARCGMDGTWQIAGEVYCIDITAPEIECTPIIIVNLEPGETSGNVTWNPPEVVDNSGSARVFTVTGPEPGWQLELGTYTVEYRAEDDDGNLSPVCSVIVIVQVLSCGLPTAILDDENIIYDCPSFHMDVTCSLSCVDNYVIDGPDAITCIADSDVNPTYVQWEDVTVSCIVEDCPPLPDLDNGIVECNNSSWNESDVSSCVLVCDEGYRLPYRTAVYYYCGDSGSWTPDTFPNACSPEGEQAYTEYTLQITDINHDCLLEDTDTITADFIAAMEKQLPAMTSCKPPYTCEMGHVTTTCEADIFEINFNVLVTCSDMQGTACDLTYDNMVSVVNDVTELVEERQVLDFMKFNVTDDWLSPIETNFPECEKGYILVAAFCEFCDFGWFYDERGGKCNICPVGAYGDTVGRWACITCPESTTSLVRGATNVTDCRAPCDSGTYSATGYWPCAKCMTGQYQPDTAQTLCIPCDPGHWTSQEGSISPDQCIEYDVYFEYDQPTFTIVAIGTHVSVAFWMNSFGIPLVTIGGYYDDTEEAWALETTKIAQLLFGGWDNTPTDIAIEGGVWTMVGVTWDATTGHVAVYKNGEPGFSMTLDGLTGIPDRLRMAVNSGTTISGFSISSAVVSQATMEEVASECHSDLPGAVYTTDDLAQTRKIGMKYPPTKCIASNATDVENCVNHECLNDGICVPNDTLAYTCNCTELYGGPFCECMVVHGNWSAWYNMTSCSRTCGSGEQTIYRLCNTPPRSEYGQDCEGNNTEVVACNAIECPDTCPSVTNDTDAECFPDENDECIPQCPAGRVLPRGQYGRTFKCGASTGHSWAPLHRLPLCSKSYAPISYSVVLTFTFVTPVPCEVSDNVTSTYEQMANNLRCITDNEDCEVTVDIDGCLTEDDTHSSTMILTLRIPLLSNDTFDLELYYATGNITDSIREAVRAITDLELTVRDIIDNPDIFNHTIYSWSDVSVAAMTECHPEFVAVVGICALCQPGTRREGGWCIYCDIGMYQDEIGMTLCKPCPINKTTEFVGARSAEECVDIVIVTTTTIGPTAAAADKTMLIIILVVVVGVVGLALIILACCYRMLLGARLRKQFDMEAETTSLYTDMPDIAYNIYYKARQVVGFDEDGLPVIAPLAIQNGDAVKTPFDTPDFRRKLLGEDFFIKPPKYGIDRKTVHIELPVKEDTLLVPNNWPTPPHTPPPPSPRPLPEPPSTDLEEPFRSRSKNLKKRFKVPKAHKSKFNFPNIKGAIRFRVPGRKHLQNKYPLSMFGLGDNRRQSTKLPVSKAAALLYQPPGGLKMYLSMASEYKRLREESSSDDEEDRLYPGVSPLHGIYRRHQRFYDDPSDDFRTSTMRMLAERPPPSLEYGPFPGRKTIDRYFKIGTPRSAQFEMDHPKPTPMRAHVVNRPWDRSSTFRSKSSMKSPRTASVRSKSTVTMQDDERKTPTMYSTRYNRPKSSVVIKDDASSVLKRPKSAFVRMETKPTPPPNVAYRPKSARQSSAVFHPKPIIRRPFAVDQVPVSARDEYTESSVEAPPVEHMQKLMQPPFLKPRPVSRPPTKPPQRHLPQGSVSDGSASPKPTPLKVSQSRTFPKPPVKKPLNLNRPDSDLDDDAAPSFFLTQVLPSHKGSMTNKWVSDTSGPPAPYNHHKFDASNGPLNPVYTNSSEKSESRPGSAGSAQYVGLPENVKSQTEAELEQNAGRNIVRRKLPTAYL